MTEPPSPDTQNQPGADFARLSKADVSELLHYKTQFEAMERISGAAANTSDQFSKRLQCSGRLMILYRDLALNTSPEQIHWLTNAAAHALRRTDPAFEWGAIGATIMSVRFTTLPGPPELQRGQQLMLSFWAWGENELEVMTNLDRTVRNVTVALRGLSDEIRRSSPATTSDG